MAWISNHIIPFSGPSEFTIHAGADFQLGSSSCDEVVVDNWIRKVAEDPNGVNVILGDLTDDDRPTTRDRKRASNADRMEVLRDESHDWMTLKGPKIVERLLPLATAGHGCLGMLAGHHWRELWFPLQDGENGIRTMNSAEWICREMSRISGRPVPYLGEMSAWIWLRFRNQEAPEKTRGVTRCLHVQHGVGGGQTLASALTKLEGTQKVIWADAFIRAHDCKRVGGYVEMLMPKDTEGEPCILTKTIPLLNLGSATKGYELSRGAPSYVEAAMMRPTTMGFGKLVANLHYRSKAVDPSHNMTCEFEVRP